ncbi:hypothetical protein ACH9D2_10160 [Kocuria sp. M4R2S49]|uniref:glycosyltransferase family protein n=1 Tax=Kocuria rhizosphaericola TaxID=3376284 RepID=UPI00378763F5
MRIVFVYWPFEDQGSGLVVRGYSAAAHAAGHQIEVYGIPYERIPLDYTLELSSADAVVFLFEWTTQLYYGDRLDLVRLVGSVPRRRRVVIDGDGNYNDALHVDDDWNHLGPEQAQSWTEMCDALTDKICQPTLHPLRDNVIPFLFYGYDPSWELPFDPAEDKEFGLLYVGHSKFRWHAMSRLLSAVEPVRNRLGRIAIVGHGWDSAPPWAEELDCTDRYRSDPARLAALGVEVLPPVPFPAVVACMNRSLCNAVLTRPMFQRLRIVTPRSFETPAAGTIPLLVLDEGHVKEIYGEAGLELLLPEQDQHEKIVDIVERPAHYAEVLAEIQSHLASHHSHRARLAELLQIIEA